MKTMMAFATDSWCRLSIGRQPLGELRVPDALVECPEYQRIQELAAPASGLTEGAVDGADLTERAEAALARACAEFAAKLETCGLRGDALNWWRAAADRGEPQAVLAISQALYSCWRQRGCGREKLEVRLARELLRTAAAEYSNPESPFSSKEDRQAQIHCGAEAINLARRARMPADYTESLQVDLWQQRASDEGIRLICVELTLPSLVGDEAPGMIRVIKHIEPSDEAPIPALVQRYERLLGPLPLVKLPDLERVRRGMKSRFPYWKGIIDLIMPLLAFRLWGNARVVRIPPLLLVGPPGIGKNELARVLGELLSLPVRMIPLGGSSDNRALQGTARGWSSAAPSSVLEAILQVEVANPLIVLDEIDKVGSGTHNGNALDTLHYLLEPSTARQWFDECLRGECDLSHINWVATANRWKQLPDSLVSRFKVIEVPAPSPRYGNALITSILAAFARELGVKPAALPTVTDLERQRVLAGSPTVRALKGRLERVLGEKALEASKGAQQSRPRRRGTGSTPGDTRGPIAWESVE